MRHVTRTLLPRLVFIIHTRASLLAHPHSKHDVAHRGKKRPYAQRHPWVCANSAARAPYVGSPASSGPTVSEKGEVCMRDTHHTEGEWVYELVIYEGGFSQMGF